MVYKEKTMEKIIFEDILNEDLNKKFILALELNNENAEEAISSMIKQYISDSFLRESKNVISKKDSEANQIYYNFNGTDSNNYMDENDPKYGKANNRIPQWSYKKYQNNHKIIKAFFEIEKESGFVDLHVLERRCSDKQRYPNTYCSDFKGNFASMKTDASNSHGKVFITNGSRVEIWDVVKDTLYRYKSNF